MPTLVVSVLWLLLLAVVCGGPWLTASTTLGDELIRAGARAVLRRGEHELLLVELALELGELALLRLEA